MKERFCDVCGEEIFGKRDRIFCLTPRHVQVALVPHLVDVSGDHVPEAADICEVCIRDVVKNRKFTRGKQ